MTDISKAQKIYWEWLALNAAPLPSPSLLPRTSHGVLPGKAFALPSHPSRPSPHCCHLLPAKGNNLLPGLPASTSDPYN